MQRDTPKQVVDLLERVIVKGDLGTPYHDAFFSSDVFKPEIDHNFFKCERWYQLLNGKLESRPNGTWLLTIDSEFKNYGNEKELFLDWIVPYIKTRKKILYLGWWTNEDMNERQSIHLFNGKASMWHHSKKKLLATVKTIQ